MRPIRSYFVDWRSYFPGHICINFCFTFTSSSIKLFIRYIHTHTHTKTPLKTFDWPSTTLLINIVMMMVVINWHERKMLTLFFCSKHSVHFSYLSFVSNVSCFFQLVSLFFRLFFSNLIYSDNQSLIFFANKKNNKLINQSNSIEF